MALVTPAPPDEAFLQALAHLEGRRSAGSRRALHESRCHHPVEVDAAGSETVRVASAERASRSFGAIARFAAPDEFDLYDRRGSSGHRAKRVTSKA